VLIGDVHGQSKKLRHLFSRLTSTLGRERFNEARVVFLGDLCDRGPDTKDVLEFIASDLPEKYPEMEVRVLAGNHDFGLSTFLKIIPNTGGDVPDGWTNERRPEPPLWEDDVGDAHVGMHLQGRRWGASAAGMVNAFESESTFSSYRVKSPGDRNSLLAAMPATHKALLASMEFVVEIEGVSDAHSPKIDTLIAVHAGLEFDVPVDEQLAELRARTVDSKWIEALQGRANVLKPHPELPENVLVVSGHHSFVSLEETRIIMDSCARHNDRPLTAVVLSERTLVDDGFEFYLANY